MKTYVATTDVALTLEQSFVVQVHPGTIIEKQSEGAGGMIFIKGQKGYCRGFKGALKQGWIKRKEEE